jgi:hypothetical protein
MRYCDGCGVKATQGHLPHIRFNAELDEANICPVDSGSKQRVGQREIYAYLRFRRSRLIVAIRSSAERSTRSVLASADTSSLCQVLLSLGLANLNLLLLTTTAKLLRLEGVLGLELCSAMFGDVSLRHGVDCFNLLGLQATVDEKTGVVRGFVDKGFSNPIQAPPRRAESLVQESSLRFRGVRAGDAWLSGQGCKMRDGVLREEKVGVGGGLARTYLRPLGALPEWQTILDRQVERTGVFLPEATRNRRGAKAGCDKYRLLANQPSGCRTDM